MTMLIAACLHLNSALAAPQSIKIALVAPFTGPYGAYGTLLLSGAMQAANDINAKGGLKGVTIEILPVDDQCSPDIAVKQAENIIKDQQYQAVIGHVCSAATLATSSMYARAKVLTITPTATNDKITDRKFNTVFRMTGTDQQQSVVAANFIAKTLKSKRIAILHDQELYSKDLADLVSEQLLHLDTAPVLYQGVARGTRNFTPIIKKIKSLNADAIYFAGLYPEVAALAKTLNVLELQIPLITADGVALNKFSNQVGSKEAARAVLMTFGDNPSSFVSSRAVINNMQERNLETTGYALYAYAAVQVIVKAIEVTNSTEGHILANWLHQHEVDTVLGKKSWDTNGNVNNCKFRMYTMQSDNKLTPIQDNS
ncbi:MAG TPA: branched-chain amino acid ABC transporter substrate-binding protein [Gammaproteobacteria bacterium]|nr:branched-chain amino acid ABC transporter substrate-binding protein [Gammaproteobacteria bacterium]